MRVMALVFLVVFASNASALRSTDFEAYTDPDFLDYRFDKILFVSEGDFETNKVVGKILTKEFSKRKVSVLEARRLFPPTREWSAEDRNRILKENGIDAVLVVTPGAASALIIPAMSVTYGSGSGNVNSDSGNFSITGTASSHQIYSASSSAGFSAVLFDVNSSRTV